MTKRTLNRIRAAIRNGTYDMTMHASEGRDTNRVSDMKTMTGQEPLMMSKCQALLSTITIGSCLLLSSCGGNAVVPANSDVIHRLENTTRVHAIHFVPPSLGYQPPETTSPLPRQLPDYPEFIDKIGLDNPSEHLKISFVSKWKENFPSMIITSVSEAFPYRDLVELRKKYSPNLILEFDTERWLFGGAFREGPFLHVQFEAHSHLTDPASGKILWRGHCSIVRDIFDEGSGKRMKLTDLSQKGWKPLKNSWKQAAEVCANEMLVQFSG